VEQQPRDDARRPQQPSQQPWPQPSQPFAAPPAQHSFASVHGLGTAVSILICLVVLAQAGRLVEQQ